MADDANWSKVAPALGGTGTGEAAILHTVAIARSDPRLPGLMTGHWRTQRKLEIKVADGGAPIDGVVALAGLPSALPKLNAECGQK